MNKNAVLKEQKRLKIIIKIIKNIIIVIVVIIIIILEFESLQGRHNTSATVIRNIR